MKTVWRLSVTVVVLLASLPGSASAKETAGPIRLIPETQDSWIRIDARFAPKPDLCPARQPRNLHAGYPGVLEVGRRSDGRLYLVTELDFPRYLRGIAEVPRNWPLDALKAQVVAARTYAVSHMNPSTALARELNYNLCATDACQVYRGRMVEAGAWGDEWGRAVDETAGEILEYGGRPASTFYFSTSNGRTYSNAEAFGGTPLPYLQPVEEHDDTGSPVSSWEVRMPLEDMAETLRLSGLWGAGDISGISQEGGSVRITGPGGDRSLTVDRLRANLNARAVCLTPKRYPTPGSEGRSLPQVIPSKWYEVRQDGDTAVFSGRGWGHGVGMVQWGLKGKAERGMGYAEMLAFYYGGLGPVIRDEPGGIRVGLAIDIEEIAVERMGSVRVEGADVPEGPLVLRGGSSISAAPGPPIAPVLRIDNAVAEIPAAGPSAPVRLTFEPSAAANIVVGWQGPGGVGGKTAPEPRDRGPSEISWDPAGGEAQLASGTYEVMILANDGVDEASSTPIAVAVTAPSPSPVPEPSPTPVAAPTRARATPLIWILAVGALVIAGASLLFLRRGHRSLPGNKT